MRILHCLSTAFIALVLAGCAATVSKPPPEARGALSPNGTLRGAVLLNTSLQVSKTGASGELQGVAIDLGRELARRLGVSYVPVPYQSIELLMAGAKTGQWDIAFMAVDHSRDSVIDYVAPVMDVEMGYLVPENSTLLSIDSVDQPGNRIVVAGSGGTDLLLSRVLKNAQIVRANGVAGLIETLKAGKADAAAANKPTLYADAEKLSGWRVLDGRITAAQYAIVTRKGLDAGHAYLRAFVEEMRNEGLIRAAIAKAGLRGVGVAAAK